MTRPVAPRRGGARARVVAAAAALSACGYAPMYATPPGGARLHVALVHARVADGVTNDEVVRGVREALAREGALAAGRGYPRVEIEVLRADEASEGVADVSGAPRARASSVGVVARAWIVRAKGGPIEADTGDVRAVVVAASPGDGARNALPLESLRHDDALRAAARRAGERVGRRVLGHPVASDEPEG